MPSNTVISVIQFSAKVFMPLFLKRIIHIPVFLLLFFKDPIFTYYKWFCNFQFPEPEETDLTEDFLQNLYSQPPKRKKIDASPGSLGESNDRDCKSRSLAEISHSKYPGVSCSEEADKDDTYLVSATPPEVSRIRNPFARQPTSPKENAVSNNQFSALKKLSRMKKTVINSDTVIQSR